MTYDELMRLYGNIGPANVYTVDREVGASGSMTPYSMVGFENAPSMGNLFQGELGWNYDPEAGPYGGYYDIPVTGTDSAGTWRGKYNDEGVAQDFYFDEQSFIDKNPWAPAALLAAAAYAPTMFGGQGAATGATGGAGATGAATGGLTASELAAADMALGGMGGSAGAGALSSAMAGGIYSPLAMELGWDIAANGMDPAMLGGNMAEGATTLPGFSGSTAPIPGTLPPGTLPPGTPPPGTPPPNRSLIPGVPNKLLGPLAGATLGGLSAATSPDSETVERRPYVDPRVDAMLMGSGGLMPFGQSMATRPIPAGLQAAGDAASNWVGANATGNLNAAQGGVNWQLGAPGNQQRLQSVATHGTPLTQAFGDMVYGQPGGNPYLMQALQRAGDQSRYNFQNLLGDMGQNYSENVLGNIRGGAIQAGGMGGSRQGIAEGMAAREFAKQAGRAATQYGQDLSSAMVGAQAGAYDADRNRAAGLIGTGLQQDTAIQGQNQASQLGTQQLQANTVNQGIGNAGNLLGQAYNMGAGSYNLPMTNYSAGMQAMYPMFNMYGSGSNTTTPLYNNPFGSILGGAIAGGQLAKLWG